MLQWLFDHEPAGHGRRQRRVQIDLGAAPDLAAHGVPLPAGLKHRHDDGRLAYVVLSARRAGSVRAAAWAQSAAAGTAQISATRRAVIMTIKVTIGGVETLRLADIAPAIERTVLLRMSQVAYDAMQTGAARHTKTGVLFQSIYIRSARPMRRSSSSARARTGSRRRKRRPFAGLAAVRSSLQNGSTIPATSA